MPKTKRLTREQLYLMASAKAQLASAEAMAREAATSIDSVFGESRGRAAEVLKSARSAANEACHALEGVFDLLRGQL